MDVVFRVDASTRIGSGHIMRCLNLAHALRERGSSARFVCRPHDGHLVPLLERNMFPVSVLSAPSKSATPGDEHQDWIGAPPSQDAGEMAGALVGRKPDWLVADHYGLDAEWERHLRPHARRIMVIDDLANRLHECDLLLDQNYHEEGARRYAGLVSSLCRVLVGPKFAILAREFAAAHVVARPRDAGVARVLVYFGGSDPRNATGFALDAMALTPLSQAVLDVLVGPGYRHEASLTCQLRSWRKATLHRALPHLAGILSSADLAIGAGGITTWERLCLGVPSVVVSVAENQHSSCESLGSAGLIEYAGALESLDCERLRDVLERILEDADRRKALSARGLAMVDGLGAARVAEIMLDD